MKRPMTAFALLFVMVATETRMLADDVKTPPTAKPESTDGGPKQPKVIANPAPNLEPMSYSFYVDDIGKDGVITSAPYSPDPEKPLAYVTLDCPDYVLQKGQVFTVTLQPAKKPDGTARLATQTPDPTLQPKVTKPAGTEPNVAPASYILFVNDIANDGQIMAALYEPGPRQPMAYMALLSPGYVLRKDQVFTMMVQPAMKQDGTAKVANVQDERDNNDEIARQQEVDEIKGLTESILGKKLTPQQKIIADGFFGSALKKFDDATSEKPAKKPEDKK